MAVTNIDDAFAKIEKDFVELSKTAARNAATKAQKDIEKKANDFIGEYYKYDAKWYKKSRKHALYDLVQKYYQERKQKKGIAIEFGVQYYPSKIRGVHKSYSPYHQSGSKWISRNDSGFKWDGRDNGIPEPEWITENFLEGVHYVYEDGRKIQDKQSPDEKMQKFFDKELGDLVMTYMNRYLLDLVKHYF